MRKAFVDGKWRKIGTIMDANFEKVCKNAHNVEKV